MRFHEPAPLAREAKPAWVDVPAGLKQVIEDELGARVAVAETAWGGYTPSATFRLSLTDGRRVFIKGTHPGQTHEGRMMLAREERCYREIPALAEVAPAFLGSVAAADWSFLLLEDVAGAAAPLPWNETKIGAIAKSMAGFYRRAESESVPDWVGRIDEHSLVADLIDPHGGWSRIADIESQREGFLSLFLDPAAAAHWLANSLSRLTELQRSVGKLLVMRPGRPSALLHLDLRSDNILLRDDGRAVILDWPFVTPGPIALDVVLFAPSVAGEGGPHPSKLVAAFEQAIGSSFDMIDLQVALAVTAGYFAESAHEPSVPGLPRVRWVQRLQLAACLAWASELIGLPAAPPMTGQMRPR